MPTNRITPAHLAMVRCIEQAGGRRVTVDDIAQCASITPGTAIAYISYLRRQYGYTSIDGTPAKGYRLGEWPGREVPGRKGRPRGVVEQRHRVARHYRFDSGDGVVVTAAGKALGL